MASSFHGNLLCGLLRALRLGAYSHIVLSLPHIAASRCTFTASEIAWLQRLVADWQIIADLSFADLLLWLPDQDGSGFWAGAQIRPTTGPTSHPDDLVGSFLAHGRRRLIDAAWETGRVARDGDPEWRDSVPVRVEAIPVCRQGSVLGVIARNTNLLGVRTPSRLELAYLRSAADLTTMISRGRFPSTSARSDHTDSPRVGDGFIRLDPAGSVEYASPNALSVYRRLGLASDLTGLDLASVTRQLVPPARRPDEETVSAVFGGQASRDTELGAGGTVVVARSIRLFGDQEAQVSSAPSGPGELFTPQPTSLEADAVGAVILLRDVTDLRSRDRELITKDATIREIHHRVKNNLQTVAALLRLQARRMDAPEAAAALREAERRVGSIAMVHETLSRSSDESVDFDDIVDRLRHSVSSLSPLMVSQITTSRVGSFGDVTGEVATPLAMVLTELLQNAAEHAFAGRAGIIEIAVVAKKSRLVITVTDDGKGLPEGFDPGASGSLGMSIVHALVTSELGGTIDLRRGEDTGTVATIELPRTAP